MNSEPIFLNEFSKVIDDMGFFEDNPHIAVGVSGGPDSLALMLLLNEWVRTINGKLTVFAFNHGIRKESKNECDYVKLISESIKLDVELLKWDGEKIKTRLMQKAREVRYNSIAERCVKKNILHLMVGHHLDDRIETFFMREKRIGNIVGLSSIPWIREYQNLRIMRPFLNFSKDRLKATCKAYGVKWVEDSSNNNQNFERTMIRNQLKFENNKFKEKYKKKINFHTLRRIKYEEIISEFLVKFLKFEPYGKFYLEKIELFKLKKNIQTEILKRILLTNSGKLYPPKKKSVESLIKNINYKKNSINTLCSNLVVSDEKLISFTRESKKTFNEMKNGIIIKTGNSKIWDFRFLIKSLKHDLFCEPITISNWIYIRSIFFKNQTRKIHFDILRTLPLIRLSKKTFIPFITPMKQLKEEGIIIMFHPKVQLTSNKFLIIN